MMRLVSVYDPGVRERRGREHEKAQLEPETCVPGGLEYTALPAQITSAIFSSTWLYVYFYLLIAQMVPGSDASRHPRGQDYLGDADLRQRKDATRTQIQNPMLMFASLQVLCVSGTLSCHCNALVELSPKRTSTELQGNARHYEEHGRHNAATQIPRTSRSMQKL